MFVERARRSVGMRLATIFVITVILMIPTIMIQALISERKDRRDVAAEEVSQNWGSSQVVIGPIITVPLRFNYYDDKNSLRQMTQYAHFLPEQLDIKGGIKSQVRRRGIYDIVLYNSDLELSGRFKKPDFEELGIQSAEILYESTRVEIGITDMKGIRDTVSFLWNDQELPANSGLDNNEIFNTGLSVKIDLSEDKDLYTFKTKIKLNGSESLMFAPVGNETKVNLNSDWNNPGFFGAFLPDQRTIDENGFDSNWKVLHLSREYPQAWKGHSYNINKSLFGVNLLLKVDEYQKTTRTVKYALLFISLTFLTFFLIEILSNKAIHPIQYLLIGVALVIFYTLLLSMTEYVAFHYAYLIASVGIIALVSMYTRSVLASKTQALIIMLVLILLYGYLYIILQLQDYALLMGSIILFVALALTMYFTRNIDWFTVLKNDNKIEKKPENS